MALDESRSRIEHFMSLKDGYLRLLRSMAAGDVSPENLLRLHFILADLQKSVLALPAVTELDTDAPVPAAISTLTDEELRPFLSSIGLDGYSFVFDPLADLASFDLPIVGSLAHDLISVRDDLEKGAEYFVQGKCRSAIWAWRWGYMKHWGRHLLLAQCILRQYLDENAAEFLPLMATSFSDDV